MRAEPVSSIDIDATEVQRLGVKITTPFAKAIQVTDTEGISLLLFSKLSAPSKKKPNLQRNEYHELKVINFRKTSNGWSQRWVIKDFVDCPDLDSEADFFIDKIAITDLDKDGFAEISIPYHMFCGGGVDPKIIKIILRTKNEKYALRGESKIVIPGQDSIGGEMHIDSLLRQRKKSNYIEQLTKVWDSVYIEKR